MVTIPVSVGELVDKLTILEIKKIKIEDQKKLEYINSEFEILNNLFLVFSENEKIKLLFNKLIEINSKLWDIEDKLRSLEKIKSFNDYFIQLSREVYYYNDKRFEIKNEINEITDSVIREQKSYEKY